MLPGEDGPVEPCGGALTCGVVGVNTWLGVVGWNVPVLGPEDELDWLGIVAVVLGFGGAGLGFSPGTVAAAPTAVILTCAGPWTLDGLWSWVEAGGGLDVVGVFEEDEFPSAYAATNASTASTTAAITIGVAERPRASPTEARL